MGVRRRVLGIEQHDEAEIAYYIGVFMLGLNSGFPGGLGRSSFTACPPLKIPTKA
jgi:hypothetical protein